MLDLQKHSFVAAGMQDTTDTLQNNGQILKTKSNHAYIKIVITSWYIFEGIEDLCPHENLKIESDCNRFIHNCQNVETVGKVYVGKLK